MTEASSPSPLTRSLRSAGVFLVFTVVGPAVGGLLAFCLIAPIVLLGLNPGGVETSEVAPGLATTFEILPVFVAAGYAFGGPQALLTGLWAAIATWRNAGFSGLATVVAASMATLAWIVLLYSPIDPLDAHDTPNKINGAVQIALLITPIGIVCALLCRWASRALGLTRPSA